MEIHLISYGDQKYEARIEDFKVVALASSYFDQVTVFRYEDLDSKFEEQFYDVLKLTRGAYIWKPYFIKKKLLELKNNDVLVYCDAGCYINKFGKERFNQYLDLLAQSKTGILGFQLRHNEYKYTKMEVFNRFDTAATVIESGQLMATVILIKKCDHSIKMVDLWNNFAKEMPELFIDEMDDTIQHPEFVAHRHDQSIWSVLLKTHGAEIIPDETYFDNFEKQGAAFPLWAARIRPVD